MNIESLIEKINFFNELVIKSGFKRDIDSYITAIAQPENQANLVALKNVTAELIDWLERIEQSGLGDALDILSPKTKAFTDHNHLETLEEIYNDPDIDTPQFHSKLTDELNKLANEINLDKKRFDSLKSTFSEYVNDDITEADSDKAIMSIIFKDLTTIRSLKKFAAALNRWNRTLLIYHQLVSSQSPEEIELIEIQNGSIDVIFNIDTKVAIDLAEIFKMAFFMFSAYLTYKSNLHKIIPEALKKNKKMAEIEESREKLLLEEIKTEVIKKLKEQHQESRRRDKSIDNTSLTTKYEQVSALVLDHIVKGNDIKLLAAPQTDEENTDDVAEPQNELSRELREKSQEVQNLMNQLPASEIKLLANKYGIEEEEEK